MGRITTNGRGRRWLERGHRWLYADDVADGEGDRGELLPVSGPNGESLGWGLFSSHSKIAVRLVTRAAEQPNRAFWAERIDRAVRARRRLGFLHPSGACRLIAGDADGLPGWIVDRYADVLVLQSGCQGSDRMREFLVELVLESLEREGLPTPRAIFDRSDTSVRRLEDLEPRVEWLRGEAPAELAIEEPESADAPRLVYEVDVTAGHKTEHYLDQVENRRRAGRLVATAGDAPRVLDAFSYDGLFGVRAALSGAKEVLLLDQSAEAGERALRNAERNGVADRVRFEKVNAMHDLRDRAASGARFDVVVVDPPAFARNKREAEGAARGYRELNRRAAELVAEEGVLVTASCSYAVKRDDFLGYVRDATRAAGRDAWLLEVTAAATDHPVLLGLPETNYLKCAFLRL